MEEKKKSTQQKTESKVQANIFDNYEFQITSIRFFNLNTLTNDKSNPNSFYILSLFYFNDSNEWKSKMQPGEANPVSKTSYKFSQEDEILIKENL